VGLTDTSVAWICFDNFGIFTGMLASHCLYIDVSKNIAYHSAFPQNINQDDDGYLWKIDTVC
jgi:hypothetical protein